MRGTASPLSVASPRAARAALAGVMALVAPSTARAQAPADPSAPPGQFQPQPQPPAPSPFGGMNAGGLTPPPPADDPPPAPPPRADDAPLTTDEELDRSKKDDAGRGLTWLWIEAGGGFEHVGLQTFNVDDADFGAGFIETSASGAVIDGGLGARLLFLTLGARARMGFFSPWQLGRIGGEIGLRIPIGRIEPRADVGFGYAALTGISATSGAPVDASINGFYGRVGAGLDVFPKNWLALGAGVSWEVLGLTRSGLGPAAIAELAGDGSGTAALSAEGSGYGSTFAVTARAGLHF